MPYLDPSKAFPPRFEDGVLYPAIYNLDELNMNGAPVGDGAYPGLYFDLKFLGYAEGETPYISYGKHIFSLRHSISPTDYIEDDFGGYWDPTVQYPALRPGSRILFEFKDSKGTVVYSDVITNYALATNDGFRGYVWVKVDPIRTYDFIENGMGTVTFVGETIVAPSNTQWRGKYNVRTTFPVYFNLTETVDDDAGGTTYIVVENESPLFMRHTPSTYNASDGGVLFVSESIFTGGGADRSYMSISASKLETYGGKISNVSVDMKFKYIDGLSGDTVIEDTWTPVNDNIPIAQYSTDYENHIDVTYAEGLNPISFETPSAGSSSAILIPLAPDGITDYEARFKFRFKDSSPTQEYAKNYSVGANLDYQIYYPSGSDQDTNAWMGWSGTQGRTRGGIIFTGGSRELYTTSDGHFDFNTRFTSIKSGLGGQKVEPDGSLIRYGIPGEDRKGGPGGGGGGSGPVN